MFHQTYRVPKAKLPLATRPGAHHGNEATALGFAAAHAKRELFYGSYPITLAYDALQYLATYKSFGA
ncbi:MAG: hypothetical protein U0838_07065 [Chloroflexota bacterium]